MTHELITLRNDLVFEVIISRVFLSNVKSMAPYKVSSKKKMSTKQRKFYREFQNQDRTKRNLKGRNVNERITGLFNYLKRE